MLCFFSDLVKSDEEPIDRFMSNKVTGGVGQIQ